VEIIKASDQALGLDPTRFSSKSLRIGFATYASANDIAPGLRNSRAGWAPGSTVPDLYYSKDYENGGLFAWEAEAASAGGNYGLAQLHRHASAPNSIAPKPAASHQGTSSSSDKAAASKKAAARNKAANHKRSAKPAVQAAAVIVPVATKRVSTLPPPDSRGVPAVKTTL
jgi:hypothetical protein